jgi:hypothetical protein
VRGTFCNDDLQGGPDMAFAEVAGLSAAVPGAQHNVDMKGGLAFGVVRNVAD